MSKSNAQKIAQQKYDQKAYDQILIKVRKGKREEYRLAAEEMGLGQMELFRRGVEEYIANHGGELPATPPKPESISAADKRLVEEFNQLPVEAQKHFLKAFRAINEVNAAPMSDDREDKI